MAVTRVGFGRLATDLGLQSRGVGDDLLLDTGIERFPAARMRFFMPLAEMPLYSAAGLP